MILTRLSAFLATSKSNETQHVANLLSAADNTPQTHQWLKVAL